MVAIVSSFVRPLSFDDLKCYFAFKQACWVRRFDQSRDGRSWSGYFALVGGKFDPSSSNLSALAIACAEVYRNLDGFQGSVEVEHFGCLLSWHEKEHRRSISQITIYTEDRPQSRMGWEEGHLQRQIHRFASELHLTYCAAGGAVDVVAKGWVSIRKKIAALSVPSFTKGQIAEATAHPKVRIAGTH